MYVDGLVARLGFIIASGATLIHAQQTATNSSNSNSTSSLPLPSNLPSPWRYQGCYTDSPQARTLTNTFTRSNTTMTQELCIEYCSPTNTTATDNTNKYPYAGLSYGQECFCGYALAPTSNKTGNDSECNFPCTGNANQACGGNDRVTLLWNGQAAPDINPGPSGWTNSGCYNDTPSARVLTGSSTTGDDMTIAKCTRYCRDQKLGLAGIEWGRECYCGNQQEQVSVMQSVSQCNFLCGGNASEFCGGNGVMLLYRSTGGAATTTTVVPTSILLSLMTIWLLI